jgi:hypothetical protein
MLRGADGRKMLFALFSPSKVDAYARTLANEVTRRYPPAVANDPERTISQERRTAILEEIFADAHRFNEEHRPGIFRRASLGNTFRWALREGGYGEDFIDTAAALLMACLLRGHGPGLGEAGRRSAME